MAGNTQETGGRRRSRWRSALWAFAALGLLVPLVAGAPWTMGDYVFAAALMFGSLGLYELAARLTGNRAYRTGAALALAATFLLVWVNGAVGITDSEADGLFLLVPAVGFIGALVARFRPRGMAVAMFTAALAEVAIVVIALIAGLVPAFNSAFEVLGIAGFFGMMFVGSGLLFHEAARQRATVDAEAST
ncbi:MAG TPA: hypothetical protein VLA33_11560 [Gemmatimonadota bacterium]|nr:hypothetical protein [Gemmatimonadota bacterium]